MKSMATMFLIAGAVLILIGLVLWLGARFNLPLGRLPGDVNLNGKNWFFHFPLVTSIIISIILTILLNLFLRR